MPYWYHFAIMFEALSISDDDRYGHARGAFLIAGSFRQV